MEGIKKQAVYGRIAKWAMAISVVSIIVFCVGIRGTGFFACKLLPWLIILPLLGFPASIILAVVYRILARKLPRFFIGYVLIMMFFFSLCLALPNQIAFTKRERQYEAIRNLTQIYDRQEQHRARIGNYARTFKELGWNPSEEIKYNYFLSPQESMKSSCRSCNHALPAGTNPNVTDDSFIIVAIGNIDCDPFTDVWSVNSQKQLTNDMDDKRNGEGRKEENFFAHPPFRPEDYD